jgi:hypothetical protein
MILARPKQVIDPAFEDDEVIDRFLEGDDEVINLTLEDN